MRLVIICILSGFLCGAMIGLFVIPATRSTPESVEPTKPTPPVLRLIRHEACTIGSVEGVRTMQLSDGTCWLVVGEAPNVRLFTKANITDPWAEVPPVKLPRLP